MVNVEPSGSSRLTRMALTRRFGVDDGVVESLGEQPALVDHEPAGQRAAEEAAGAGRG